MDDDVRRLQQQVAADPAVRPRYAATLRRGRSVGACAALLAELQRWDAASELDQDATFAWVASTTPGVVWTGAETFACGGQRHRIGVFEHEATGIALHLLPGGEYLRGTLDPEREVAWWLDRLPPPTEYFDPTEERLRRSVVDEAPAYLARVRPLLVAREVVTEGQWLRGPRLGRFLFRDEERAPELPHVDSDPLYLRAWVEAVKLRLPWDVEWEWACRAGTTTRFYWGDELDDARVKSFGTPPVPASTERANAFGLRDMVGNAYDLCADPTDSMAQYRSAEEQAALTGYSRRRGDVTYAGDGRGHRLRGGRFWTSQWDCRSASRTVCGSGTIFATCVRPVLDVRFGVPAAPVELTGPGEAEPAPAAPSRADDERRFGAVVARLVLGDIAFRPVDAVVNAANDQLSMGGGVAGALRSAGGLEIQREASGSAPAPLGSVVRTGAGALLADRVYHAVVIRYDLRGGTSAETVRVAMREVMRLAREDELASLAVPLLGAGVGGLSVSQSLDTILEALEERAEGPPLTVEVVALDGPEGDDARAAFRAFRDRATRDADEQRLAQEYLEQLERGGG